MTEPSTQQIIRELNRAKVLFQQRAVAAVLGIPAESIAALKARKGE